jgi:hypothetical protein
MLFQKFGHNVVVIRSVATEALNIGVVSLEITQWLDKCVG